MKFSDELYKILFSSHGDQSLSYLPGLMLKIMKELLQKWKYDKKYLFSKSYPRFTPEGAKKLPRQVLKGRRGSFSITYSL